MSDSTLHLKMFSLNGVSKCVCPEGGYFLPGAFPSATDDRSKTLINSQLQVLLCHSAVQPNNVVYKSHYWSRARPRWGVFSSIRYSDRCPVNDSAVAFKGRLHDTVASPSRVIIFITRKSVEFSDTAPSLRLRHRFLKIAA